MAVAGNPVLYLLACLFVAMVGLFGAFLLFARAENIERNYLVGTLTVLFVVIAGVMLWQVPAASQTGPVLLSISLTSLVGFGFGRLVDYLMGPRAEPSDNTEATLGADLAD